ncbi:hypothetical protein HZS_7411, partial [Henneguya salminicola]
MDLSSCLTLLKSERKIDRDEAFKIINQSAKNSKNFDLVNFVDEEIRTIPNPQEMDWKKAHSMLCLIQIIIKNSLSLLKHDSYILFSLSELEHPEFRVRLLAGELIGEIASKDSHKVYQMTICKIIELIKSNLTRESEAVPNETHFDIHETEKLMHDTSGWKFLETSMKSLQSLIKGCADWPGPIVSIEIINLLIDCSRHLNRFVRETSMYVFNSIFEIDINSFLIKNNLIEKISECLVNCLSDNWSQVRLAASVSARCFLTVLVDPCKSIALDYLLPPICLNRHYLAEGVKLYNIKTWQMITNSQGLSIVEKNMDKYINFYISQAKADNHAVREASCHCLTELGYLLAHALNETHLQVIYDNLLFCFMDESWPVRDTSCLALGVHVSSHPLFFENKLNDIFPLFFRNLSDSIQSVRIGAAISLAYVSNTLPDQTYEFLNKYVFENLDKVKDQDPDVEKYQDLSKKPGVFGVVKQLYDNDSNIHTDQVMYSCGSLAPKMKSGQKSGGCSSHSFSRKAQPWEISDGCICLFGELSKFFSHEKSYNSMHSTLKVEINSSSKLLFKNLMKNYLQKLSETLNYRSYALHYNLLQTFFVYFSHILRFLSISNVMDPNFQLFTDHLYYAITQQKFLSDYWGGGRREKLEKLGIIRFGGIPLRSLVAIVLKKNECRLGCEIMKFLRLMVTYERTCPGLENMYPSPTPRGVECLESG